MANIGDVFAIPLGQNKAAIGQLFAKKAPSLALVIVFKETFPESDLPSGEKLEHLVRSEPVIMASSFDSPIDRGEWRRLANFPPAVDALKSPAFRDPIGLAFSFRIESYD